MPIRNTHWYSINEGISYPIDDAALCVGDGDTRLPNNIITDLYLRWPETLGRYAFLASMSVTPTLVSLTIQGCDSLDGPPNFTPLAVLAVTKPIDQGRQYAFKAQAQGVGGWVVFGSGVEEEVPYRGRFSSPRQAFLTARAARAYRVLPVSGMRALQADAPLQGIVLLKANDPLYIAKEEREIDGVLRDAIVVRLLDGAGIDGFPVPEEARQVSGYKEQSVFKRFSGPCAGRPESNTCGDPNPIEFINAVGPSCDGTFTLEFKGCAQISKIIEPCGIAIDCGLGLVDACLPAALPDSEGRLPSEYDPVNVPVPPDIPPPPDPGGESESAIIVGGLPYLDCFTDGEANNFQIKIGLWQMVEDLTDAWKDDCPYESESHSCSYSYSYSESGSVSWPVEILDCDPFSIVLPQHAYATNTAATRNVAVWEGFDESTLNRRFKTNVRMLQGPAGAKHNAGLVVNYRPHSSIGGQFVYYLAELDYDSQQVKISRFNGTNFQAAASFTIPGIQLDKWYEITVETVPASGGSVAITARFRSLEDTALDVTLGPLQVNNFLPSSGRAGFGTNRAISRFSYIKVEEI